MKKSSSAALRPPDGFALRAALAHFFCLVVFLTGCSKTEPEQQIRENIEAIKTAIEEKDAGDMKVYLGDQFIGNDQLDRQQLYRFAVGIFLQHGSISAHTTTLHLSPDNDPYYWTMSGTALLTSTGSTFRGLLPEDGRLVSFTGRWQNIDGDWLLIKLDWQQ